MRLRLMIILCCLRGALGTCGISRCVLDLVRLISSMFVFLPNCMVTYRCS